MGYQLALRIPSLIESVPVFVGGESEADELTVSASSAEQSECVVAKSNLTGFSLAVRSLRLEAKR